MYNRYKSQNDGTFLKRTFPDNFVPEKLTHESPAKIAPPPMITPHKAETTRKSNNFPKNYTATPTARYAKSKKKEESAVSFLRNLLPKDLDASDLLVILLLLLISGDCPDEQNNALLTLALYLFL